MTYTLAALTGLLIGSLVLFLATRKGRPTFITHGSPPLEGTVMLQWAAKVELTDVDTSEWTHEQIAQAIYERKKYQAEEKIQQRRAEALWDATGKGG